MERSAKAAECLLARSQGPEALAYAMQAAELYMRAATEASGQPDAPRLRRKCKDLIARAEQLKAQQKRSLNQNRPSDEESLLERVSRLHGNEFPLWRATPGDAEFRLAAGEKPFSDDAVFSLSAAQAEILDGWTRPCDLSHSSGEVDLDTLMDSGEGCDLVQDITTDCSVVASLSAAMSVLTGKHAVLSTIIYPFDHARGRPQVSSSGRYVLRMYFNGCARTVVIDDKLPASQTERTLFVVDRKNPALIWPALLEKAYLKVRGGYDFPGSNSGTDLWVLTGWIPEQVFLQREDLDIDEVWARIKPAYDDEDVIITLGTGRISREEEEALGLIGEHDYAVQGLKVQGGARRLLLKNPWCNGAPRQGSSATPHLGTADPAIADEPLPDGFLWVTIEDVAQNFESMYLNWNPSLFSHRRDLHFSWTLPPPQFAACLAQNPQYCIRSPAGGSVWILISRHFKDAELDIARTRKDSMAAVSRQLGFTSIVIFDNGGKKVRLGEGEIYRGPYVDSPQTLARLDASPGCSYTVALDQQGLPLPAYTFTLSTFSQNPVEVKAAEESMPLSKDLTGSWTRRTAGGSAACSTYFRNPQYRVTVPRATPVSFLLSTDSTDVHVHVDLVWADGKRVMTLRAKDLVGSSGEYRRACAMADIPSVDAGVYTLVCSTFDAGQLASFGLQITSMQRISIGPIPSEAAGMLRMPLPAFQLGEGEEVRQASVTASWMTRASVTVFSPPVYTAASFSVLLRVSVVRGQGSSRTPITVTGDGEFQEASSVALRLPEFEIEPERIQNEGMWLVVESIAAHGAGQSIECEVLSDSPLQVGPWELVYD